MLRVKVFENPESINDSELSRLAARLTPECRTRAQRYKYRSGRAQSLVADGLLLDLVGEVTGARVLPQCGVAGSAGKPIFVHRPDLHFNKSHCPRAVVCALGDEPVGVDVEAIPEVVDAELCERCFSAAEIADIMTADDPAARFAQQWTRKESLVKLEGVGIIDDMPLLSRRYPYDRYHFDTHISEVGRYVYTICTHIRHKQEITSI
ncbi:MAG: 4'-phosphopantetheinyl transferase family protein [Muribaculaceae bacterium]